MPRLEIEVLAAKGLIPKSYKTAEFLPIRWPGVTIQTQARRMGWLTEQSSYPYNSPNLYWRALGDPDA
jgi:hypothetical protein